MTSPNGAGHAPPSEASHVYVEQPAAYTDATQTTHDTSDAAGARAATDASHNAGPVSYTHLTLPTNREV